MAVLRTTGHLDLSCIHRRMVKEHDLMVKDTAYKALRCISYVQLGRVLDSIDYEAFNKLNDAYFEVNLEQIADDWYAVDGKELRGNIDGVSGEKRGENIVKSVSHEDFSSQVIGFYHGAKDSEKTVIQDYFTRQESIESAYSFDALHTCPQLLESIDSKGGIYLAQVKNNQKLLLEECIHMVQYSPFDYDFEQIEKAHGRIEIRRTAIYPLDVDYLDERWKNSGIQTLIAVHRQRTSVKNSKFSQEVACLVSNKIASNELIGLELFAGVRNHWSVESDNYVKDVTMGEDYIRCKYSHRIRVIASVFNLALNLTRKKNITNNIRVVREDFNFDRQKAKDCLSRS